MNRPAGLTSEMCEMVVQTMNQVVRRELPDERILELDARDEFPHDLIRKLLSPEVGLHLVFLPEDVGGLGGGARDICRISEEMAGADLGLATAFLAICLGTDPILVGGTPEQKAHWLGRIASEGLIVAYGVTEPEAGSNVAALKTIATPVTGEGGEPAYRLNGAKQFITNGGVAQLYTILAKAPGGPSFFVVERDTPGLETGRKEEKHGIRASNTTGLILEDVVVPATQLIGGKEGEGLRQANAVFGYTRLMVGAFGLGAGQAAIDRALAYSRTRYQFGTPLIEKEGFAIKLIVPPWVDLAAGRAYVEQTALRIDEGETDLQVEGAVAKLWSTEAGNRAADSALQALGGYGYTREYMVEKYRRDVRITSIYEGTSEIQQNIIGLYRWKETVRSKGAFYEEQARRMDELHVERGDLGADLAARSLRATNAVIQACHQARLTKHQMVVFGLADLAVPAEIAAALAAKAARLGAAGDRRAEEMTLCSRIFARRALGAVEAGGRLCLSGFAGADGGQADEAPLREALGPDSAGAAARSQWLDMGALGALLKDRD